MSSLLSLLLNLSRIIIVFCVRYLPVKKRLLQSHFVLCLPVNFFHVLHLRSCMLCRNNFDNYCRIGTNTLTGSNSSTALELISEYPVVITLPYLQVKNVPLPKEVCHWASLIVSYVLPNFCTQFFFHFNSGEEVFRISDPRKQKGTKKKGEITYNFVV